MAKFVKFKRGGLPGKVAINADQVTDVRSSAGPFTDVFCGDHQITVEGSFDQVVAMLTEEAAKTDRAPAGVFTRVA